MELVDSSVEMHKKELANISEAYKHELAIKDAYFKGFKDEILEQLATVTTKVIELQKKLVGNLLPEESSSTHLI